MSAGFRCDTERADLAESSVPVAADLVCRVRDGDADGIKRLAEVHGWDQPTAALLVVLAAMVDDSRPVGDLLAWTEEIEAALSWRQAQLPLPKPGPAPVKPCGTYPAARRHQRNDEEMDPACEEAYREYRNERQNAVRPTTRAGRRAGAGSEMAARGEADERAA